MPKNIRFRGLPNTNSGYGDATSYFCLAFFNSGHNIYYDFQPSDHYHNNIKNKLIELYPEFENFKEYNNRSPKIHISFTIGTPTPVSGKEYNILYFYWETDTLPRRWINEINQYDEIWTPCSLVKEAVIKAGFSKVVKVVPTPNIDHDRYSKFVIGHKSDVKKRWQVQ